MAYTEILMNKDKGILNTNQLLTESDIFELTGKSEQPGTRLMLCCGRCKKER